MSSGRSPSTPCPTPQLSWAHVFPLHSPHLPHQIWLSQCGQSCVSPSGEFSDDQIRHKLIIDISLYYAQIKELKLWLSKLYL